MNKSEILQKEIDNAIIKIKELNCNSKNEVYQIYKSVFEKYCDLPKEDFEDNFIYELYQKTLNPLKYLFETQLESLHKDDNDIYSSDNFFLIKISILMMSPDKYKKAINYISAI